jgi:hypothetical protein
MQAWRHSGGPVIQLLLNSRRMFTSARHSAHLVIYSVSRVVVMMLSMIAGPHISVLTNVNLVMDTLVKRRAVASVLDIQGGMCVLLMFTCVESLANSRARKGVWVNALRFPTMEMMSTCAQHESMLVESLANLRIFHFPITRGIILVAVHVLLLVTRCMPNIAVISGCVLCHANFASGYVLVQIIYTASIRVNFTSAS